MRVFISRIYSLPSAQGARYISSETMSVNGKVIPHTPLAVDFWQVRKCPNTRLFFLSHMHSDHTVSLTSTWSNWPIYCSPTTATLLRLKLKVKEQWIHPLEVGDPYLLPLDDIGKEKLMVTLIDANHCPGAVMFLFEGYFGSILYTGDFRYTPTMLREPCLRTNATIDVLYLDNTNCDPNRALPSRKQATQQIKEIIRSHPHHSVVIGLYALGKEALLVDLAMEFKTWIEVTFERMETLIALELPDVFTTDVGAGRIRAVDQSRICRASLQQWNEEQPTLVILPTSRSVVSCHPNLHVVPYSDHSSYQELEDFVSALKPTSLAPIVGNCLPGSLSALLPSKKRHEILVPDSVRHYMLRQPEIQNCSLVYTSLRRRPFQPLAPKGVVFDSPVRGSKRSFGHACACGSQSLEQEACEDELDTENGEKDSECESECVFTDINKKPSPNKNREGAGDVRCLNIVQTVSDHMVMAEESVPLPQFTQSNFPSVEIANTKVCSKPVREMKGPFQTNAKVNVTALHKNHSIQHRGHVDLTLSNDESISVHSGNGIDQEGNIMSHDGSMSQHNTCGNDQQNCSMLTQNSPKKHLCSLCSMNELKEEYLVELENSLLNNLPFQEKDFQACDLQFHIFK